MLIIDSPRILTIESLLDPDIDPKVKDWASLMLGKERYKDRQGVELQMIHRTNLLTHSMRVKFLAQYIGLTLDGLEDQQVIIDFDHYKVVTAADQHDVAELITDDYPAPDKNRMTTEQKKILDEDEFLAAELICEQYFSPSSKREVERYLALHREVKERSTIEAQIVNIADKWDALGEKLHELVCGNDSFLPLVENSREAFAKFETLDFWEYLKDDEILGFSALPTDCDLEKLLRVSYSDITPGAENFMQSVLATNVKYWPMSYRAWLELSLINFWTFTPEFVFPGWFPNLGRRLGLQA